MSIKELFKNKLVIGILGGIILVLILVLISLPKKSTQQVSVPSESKGVSVITPSQSPEQLARLKANPTKSVDEQKAIEAQMKADKEYTDWEINVRTNYPWRKNLPLHTVKYYVYFDLDRRVFIGLLYPTQGDNTDLMKANILKELKQKQVPTQNYQFEWKINMPK